MEDKQSNQFNGSDASSPDAPSPPDARKPFTPPKLQSLAHLAETTADRHIMCSSVAGGVVATAVSR